MLLKSITALVTSAVLGLAIASPVTAADDETWDGLAQVKAKNVDAAYLLPGADFRPYGKVIIDPPQVSFRKNWLRDQNRSVSSVSARITSSDMEEIQSAMSEGFEEILAADFAKAGWDVVIEPGPDVLRLTPVLLNVDIAAPDKMTAGRTRTYTVQAGEATLALEVRDAETNMLLGRAVDRRKTTDYGNTLMITNRVTNRAEFERLMKRWSSILVDGLAGLKDASPLGLRADQEGR